MRNRAEVCIVSFCTIPLSMLALYSWEQYKKHAHFLIQRNEEARRLLLAVCINDNGQLIRYIDDFVDCSLIHQESLNDKHCKKCTRTQSLSLPIIQAPSTAVMLQNGAWLDHHR
ncbi:hypothetical protein CYMTET_55106 [Cymbomonas tetramitiformis]|uniref:Uncharacterized protein n=1 Tax=Cymbomonas tetramitiformis TaxID=36881 RepID=A0AAE0BEH5_9CHLO|nr:hypothetical protein CYMTET_55106 [Cymbomonas tetramitiformis]